LKTVLITGGSGFIGSHLCKLFISEGARVICVDNLLTGNKNNIVSLLENPHFVFHEFDVSKHIEIPESVDYVLHFASPASPAAYQQYSIQTLKVGSFGTYNTLGLAKAKKAVFLLASTSEVYGDPLVHPQHEDYWGNVNPIGPRGVYDEAKRFAEAITLAYHRYHKIDVKIARLFNVFGPYMRQNDGRAIPNFITQALAGEPLTVFGTGLQTRSFCYIDDIIEGIRKLLFSNCNEPVNLGNPIEMTVLELAKHIVELTKSSSRTKFCDLPQDDPKVRRPDIGRAKKILKWEPKMDLRTGLFNTIEYFKNLHVEQKR